MDVVQGALKEVEQLLCRQVLARCKDIRRSGVWSGRRRRRGCNRSVLTCKPGDRRRLVLALPMRGEAFSI
jgi:hypothetical protein